MRPLAPSLSSSHYSTMASSSIFLASPIPSKPVPRRTPVRSLPTSASCAPSPLPVQPPTLLIVTDPPLGGFSPSAARHPIFLSLSPDLEPHCRAKSSLSGIAALLVRAPLPSPPLISIFPPNPPDLQFHSSSSKQKMESICRVHQHPTPLHLPLSSRPAFSKSLQPLKPFSPKPRPPLSFHACYASPKTPDHLSSLLRPTGIALAPIAAFLLTRFYHPGHHSHRQPLPDPRLHLLSRTLRHPLWLRPDSGSPSPPPRLLCAWPLRS